MSSGSSVSGSAGSNGSGSTRGVPSRKFVNRPPAEVRRLPKANPSLWPWSGLTSRIETLSAEAGDP